MAIDGRGSAIVFGLGPLLATGGFASAAVPIGPGTIPPGPPGANVLPGFVSVDQADYWCSVRLQATGTFNLDLFSGSDTDIANGVSYLIKQVASSTVTVDGATALYTQEADFDIPWPAVGTLRIVNTDVADITWVGTARFYHRRKGRRR